MIKVRWTGAAGLSFQYDNGMVLVDPYYTRISRLKMFFGRVFPNVEKISDVCKKSVNARAVIVGHTHFDHALDLPVFAEYLDCPMIGSRSLKTLMGFYGFADRVRSCDGDDTVKIDDSVSVRMIPSEHGLVLFGKAPFSGEIRPDAPKPEKASDYRMGDVFSPLIQVCGTKFLHIGSAGFKENALTDAGSDVLFLCVPGWRKKEGYPERLLDITKPDTVVLFHFDDFLIPYRGKTKRLKGLKMAEFCDRIKRWNPSARIIVPELFETLNF